MSAPKATADDLLDEGFVSSQFGKVGDDDFRTYLGKVLAEAGRWVEAKLGAPAYAALPADSYANDCAAKAEIKYSCAVLLRRRVVNYEANATRDMAKDNANVLAELRRQSDAATQDALYWLGEALRACDLDTDSVSQGSGLASAVVQTGRYPPERVSA